MRRLAGVLLVGLFALTASVGVAAAHPVPAGTPGSYAFCTWAGSAHGLTGSGGLYHLANHRMVHYGDAHVYQCHYRTNGSQPRSNFCSQTIEWYGFGPTDYYNGDPSHSWDVGTPCW